MKKSQYKQIIKTKKWLNSKSRYELKNLRPSKLRI